jgi:hypothetical protein
MSNNAKEYWHGQDDIHMKKKISRDVLENNFKTSFQVKINQQHLL